MLPDEVMLGDCWIGMTQATGSGLILAARVGKHTDEFIEQLVVNTEGKTDCQHWHTDGWGGYERVLGREVRHIIGKDQTQQLERTNGIIRQQTNIFDVSRASLWKSQRLLVASSSEQICQSLETDRSNDAVSSELFQLDLGS